MKRTVFLTVVGMCAWMLLQGMGAPNPQTGTPDVQKSQQLLQALNETSTPNPVTPTGNATPTASIGPTASVVSSVNMPVSSDFKSARMRGVTSDRKMDHPDEYRFISLGPNITEILFDIGAENLLVGVTEECDYPPAARKLPVVGSFGHPNLETITALRPTHILAPFGSHPVLATYQRMGLPVLSLASRKVSDVLDTYKLLGDLTGQRTAAERRMRTLQAKLKLLEGSKPKRIPKVYFELWGQPPMTVGYASYINELINLAGGYNIAQTISQAYPRINPEMVIGSDPEVVILAYQTHEDLALRPGWERISAVKNHKVYHLPHSDLLLRPGPRISEGIRELRVLIFQGPEELARIEAEVAAEQALKDAAAIPTATVLPSPNAVATANRSATNNAVK